MRDVCAPDARVNFGFRAGERASTLSKVFININWTLIRPPPPPPFPLAPGTEERCGGPRLADRILSLPWEDGTHTYNEIFGQTRGAKFHSEMLGEIRVSLHLTSATDG